MTVFRPSGRRATLIVLGAAPLLQNALADALPAPAEWDADAMERHGTRHGPIARRDRRRSGVRTSRPLTFATIGLARQHLRFRHAADHVPKERQAQAEVIETLQHRVGLEGARIQTSAA